MTLSEAITRMRYVLAEPTEGFWKDAELKMYINAGIRAFCENKGIAEVQRIVVNGYLRIGEPTGTKILEAVYLYPITQTITIEDNAPASPTDEQSYVNATTMKLYTYSTTSGWVEQTMPDRTNLITDGKVREIRDGFIEFTEAQTGLLEIFVYRFPTEVDSLSDEIELPDVWSEGILAYAEAQAFLKDDNMAQYDRRMMEFARIRIAWESERVHKDSQFKNRWI